MKLKCLLCNSVMAPDQVPAHAEHHRNSGKQKMIEALCGGPASTRVEVLKEFCRWCGWRISTGPHQDGCPDAETFE